ncbi:hypothetical protein BT96DRAFT_1004938 [Gymnopus androsaceus JB14]|uniref:Uncharacterized protein n=1 Tax=Gymnopus androsaceus JB14 TaxID=1447944 RepID=A0A6A4GPS3_9AGAR|nr:hypothetical protein BT96DRAFT_1004938 [Gymnopus androsaceus JB14]
MGMPVPIRKLKPSHRRSRRRRTQRTWLIDNDEAPPPGDFLRFLSTPGLVRHLLPPPVPPFPLSPAILIVLACTPLAFYLSLYKSQAPGPEDENRDISHFQHHIYQPSHPMDHPSSLVYPQIQQIVLGHHWH